MIRIPADFKEFLRLLRSNGVKYLLVGGYAVAVHGYPRSTVDMDIWIEQETENANRAVRALEEFGFGTPDLTPALLLEPKRMLRMGVVPYMLEILTSISGVDFASCYESRITRMVDGVEIDLISLDDLKKNKAASGRLKDLDDLNHLG
jgi:predicted nucleotidyltransferase